MIAGGKTSPITILRKPDPKTPVDEWKWWVFGWGNTFWTSANAPTVFLNASDAARALDLLNENHEDAVAVVYE